MSKIRVTISEMMSAAKALKDKEINLKTEISRKRREKTKVDNGIFLCDVAVIVSNASTSSTMDDPKVY